MIEIRHVGRDEAEAFLDLLCRVFELDANRARGVFFSEPLFDLRRKWGLFESGKLQTILTTVPMDFGWGRAIGIAGVATEPSERGRGLASSLLQEVLENAHREGENAAFLFAKETQLYERCGFETMDVVVGGSLKPAVEREDAHILGYDDVRAIYDRWSNASPNRLRRDEKRWQYWKWNLRMCQEFGSGYVCIEGNVVREAVAIPTAHAWPVGPAREWLGLRSMVERLEAPVSDLREDLWLMSYGVKEPPEMFMTDQF